MKSITQHVHGTLMIQDGHASLLLTNAEPAEETEQSLYLRCALTARGIEQPIFPALLLDDWGNEVKGTDLYEWIREFGDQFPRAELFGFDLQGHETQYFLRDLELNSRPVCYAFSSKQAPLSDGVLVEAVLLPDASAISASKIKRPSSLPQPLRTAKVSWWQVNPLTSSFSSELY